VARATAAISAQEGAPSKLRLGGLVDPSNHHKTPVIPITDIQLAERDNDSRIGESGSVPVSRDGHRIRHNPILGSSLTIKRSKTAANSLVLKDFSYKSFKPKDLAGISS
jgi:hypothetical protein